MIVDCPCCNKQIKLSIDAAAVESSDFPGCRGRLLLILLKEKHALSVISLSKKIRATPPHLSRMLHGKSKITENYARRFSVVFNVPWELLVGEGSAK